MNLNAIRTLRARCDASLGDCREALQATGDDVDAALAWLGVHGRLPVVEPVAPIPDGVREAAARYDAFRELYREVMATAGDVSGLVAPFAELDEESRAEVVCWAEAGIRARRIVSLRAYRALGREVTVALVQEALGPGSTEPVRPFLDELLREPVAPEILAFLASRVERFGESGLPGRIRWLLTSSHEVVRQVGVEWRERWRAAVSAGEDPGPLAGDLGFPIAWRSDAFSRALAIAGSASDDVPAELSRLARGWRDAERLWLEWLLVDQVLAGRDWAREPLSWVAGELARRVLGIEPTTPPRSEPDLRDLVLAAARPLDASDLARLAAGNTLERALHAVLSGGDLRTFYQAVGDRLGVGPEQLGAGFRDYVEATLGVAAVDGPLAIDGIAVALRTPMTLDHVVTDGSFGDRAVPAIRIGGDGEADFWLPIVGLAFRLRTLDRVELVAQSAAYRQHPALYPDPADAFVKWFAEVGWGFGPEGLIRLQVALRGVRPSEPLLRELLARYSDYGRIDVSEWTYTAPAFVRRLAPDPFEAALDRILSAPTPEDAEAILREVTRTGGDDT